jgi:O-antigen/teichoic acid export membrane protein
MRRITWQNPIARLLAAIGAVMLAAVAIFVGAMVFLAFLGLAVIAVIVFYIRLWWIRRRIRQAQRDAERSGGSGRQQGAGRVIEGEYSEIRSRDPLDR